MSTKAWVAIAMVLSAAMAGCLGSEDEPDAGSLDAASDEDEQSPDGAGGPLGDGNGEEDASRREPTVVHEQTFEGMAPEPQAEPVTGPTHDAYKVTVPANATMIQVWQNSTYTGMWPALVRVYEPSGDERIANTDACNPSGDIDSPGHPGVMADWSCLLNATSVDMVPSGDWTIEVVWQLGEVYEEYTLDVLIWGYPVE